MSLALAALNPGATLGTTLAPIYTAPANTTAIVKQAVFTNTSGGAVTFTVSITPSGGTARVLISARSIAAGGTDLAPELINLVLATGGVINASASAGTSINVVMSGMTA
jgi:hypothetical protein